MSVDPASIPQHVLDAAKTGYARGPHDSFDGELAHAVAAALDALMDPEPVEVPAGQYRVWVRPSDVLAAVLERA